MDAYEPWRDWFCLAVEKVIWREDYNPITGITKPAVMGHERCVQVNGDCDKFVEASIAEVTAPAPAPDPVTEGESREVKSAPAPKRDWSCMWLPWRRP